MSSICMGCIDYNKVVSFLDNLGMGTYMGYPYDLLEVVVWCKTNVGLAWCCVMIFECDILPHGALGR